jgi:hypothetical protein
MNKKLNTIALATSLASLGFCSLTFGYQTTIDLSSTANVAIDAPSVASPLPPIVSSAVASDTNRVHSPPIVTGKLIQQASAQSAIGTPAKELKKFTQTGGLKPLNTPDTFPNPPHHYRAPKPNPVASASEAPVARVAKAVAPVTPQGSGSRSVLSPAVQDFGGSGSRQAPGGSGSRQNGFADVGPSSDGVYSNSPNGIDGTTNLYAGQDAGVSPSSGGCATCGDGLIDGACSTCGPGAAYADGPVIRDYGTFGSVSAADRYLYVDALVWTRADGDIANSNFGTLNDFDFTGGIRATFGVRDDSIFGREISFLGLPRVDQEISRTDTLGRLDVNINPITGPEFNGISTINDAFFNATAQTQRKESDLYSLEFNRVNWGWDLIKTFRGFRYLRFDDSYSVTSVGSRPVGGPIGPPQFEDVNGNFTLDASNTLIGAQIGGELFYDIGYRWSASGFSKFGIFANFSDFDFNYTNADFTADSENDSVTLSTVAELGVLAHYQIRTNLRFRAGYNVLFVGNVSTTSDNIGQSAGLFTGFEATDSDDVLFHGFNFGLEFYR